jgi:hypothetical protein
MAVYKRTYRPYEGRLTPGWSRFLVIPRYAFEDLHRSRFLNTFLIASFIYPIICALIIYVQHNASSLNLLGVQQGARGLISINVTFFMNLIGWQSMLAGWFRPTWPIMPFRCTWRGPFRAWNTCSARCPCC